MVGHSAIRRVVMGEECVGREANPDELDAMRDAAPRRPRSRRARVLVVVGAHAQRRRRPHGAVALRDATTRSSRSRVSRASSRARRSSSSRKSARVRAVGRRPHGRHVEPRRSGRSTGTSWRSTAGNLDDCFTQARGRRLRARSRRQGRRAHDPDELPGAPLVPVRLRARRHARVGDGDAPPDRREARAVPRPRCRAGSSNEQRAERRQRAQEPRALGRT